MTSGKRRLGKPASPQRYWMRAWRFRATSRAVRIVIARSSSNWADRAPGTDWTRNRKASSTSEQRRFMGRQLRLVRLTGETPKNLHAGPSGAHKDAWKLDEVPGKVK